MYNYDEFYEEVEKFIHYWGYELWCYSRYLPRGKNRLVEKLPHFLKKILVVFTIPSICLNVFMVFIKTLYRRKSFSDSKKLSSIFLDYEKMYLEEIGLLD